MNKDELIEALKQIDGFAACNIDEPSAGDLERIYQAYQKTFEETIAFKTENAELRAKNYDLTNVELKLKAKEREFAELIQQNQTLREKVQELESKLELETPIVKQLESRITALRSALETVKDFAQCIPTRKSAQEALTADDKAAGGSCD